MSLLTLYLSAVLFGLAWGITDAIQGLLGGGTERHHRGRLPGHPCDILRCHR
jgi:hypothetical protein